MHCELKIGDSHFKVAVAAQTADRLKVTVNGTPYDVDILPSGAAPPLSAPPAAAMSAQGERRPATSGDHCLVAAPIPGLILEVKVRVGDAVRAGQTVAVMEAMKMENNLVAAVDGVVKEIFVQKGVEVATGDRILRIGQPA